MKVKCDNGVEIKIEESPLYVMVTIGKKTWYWNKDTGEYSGTSFKVTEG